MYRFAIVTSHPIQYQTPLFREIAARSDIDFIVYFRKKIGVDGPLYDKDFGTHLKWDVSLLEGYKYEFVRNTAQFITTIKRKKPDALMLYGWNSLFNVFILFALKLLSIYVFLYGENPLRHEFRKNQLKIFVKKLWFRFLFPKARAFLCIGEENRKFYEFYGVAKEKLFFAPYAVDNERFIAAGKSLSANRKALRKKFGIGESDIVILFVGKLIEKKRPIDLLKACGLITKSYKLKTNSLSLVFVGDGALRSELENYAKEHNLNNVYFVGFKNQTELPQYYAIADIFVLPSGVGETWGLVVNEAMCFSLPIIVSDLVGCGPDLVRNEENGFVFPAGDKRLLALCLEALINNPEKRKKFGKRSFEIIKNYTYAEDIQGVLKALRVNARFSGIKSAVL